MGNLGDLGQLLGALDSVAQVVRRLRSGARNQTVEIGAVGEDGPIKKILTDNTTGMKSKTAHVGSIDERLKYIIDLTRKGKRNPRVQLLVAKILSRKCDGVWCVKEKDYGAEIKLIFQAVRNQVRYLMDPRGIDKFQHPIRTWGTFHSGDCDDFTSLLAALLEAAGYTTKLRIVSVKPSPPRAWSHILILVGLPPRAPTRWIPLDASVDKPAGWYPKERINAHKDYDIPA